jgi:hypothetical protein
MYLKYKRLSGYTPAQSFLSYNLINDGVWLAGGAIRSAIMDEPIADYDLFFNSNIYSFNTIIRLEELGAELIFKCPEGKLTSFKLHGMKIQCITEDYYPSMESLVDTFDITACRYATDGKVIYTRYSSVRDTLSKKINLHRVTYPVATMKRVAKYAFKGYKLTDKASKLFVEDIYEKGEKKIPLNTRVYID